jgi:hypothetical protein
MMNCDGSSLQTIEPLARSMRRTLSQRMRNRQLHFGTGLRNSRFFLQR